MNSARREHFYHTLARVTGLALVVTSVLFQRRGQLGWPEVAFLVLCIGLQESFLRMRALHRWRMPMLLAYTAAPLVLVLLHMPEIRAEQGDLVGLILNTPLPLVLVSVQIMVMYVRDAPRLVSVVLVLALFSVVIGMRQDVPGVVTPWLAAIGSLAAVYLALMYPGMMYFGVYSRRRTHLPPAARPGGVLRAGFVARLPLLAIAVLAMTLALYIGLPRLSPGAGGAGDVLEIEMPRDGRGATPRLPPAGGGTPREPASVAGLAQGVELGDFGEILRTDVPAVEVRPLFDAAGNKPVYLRAYTFATFDGISWQALPHDAGRVVEVAEGMPRALPGAFSPHGPEYRSRSYMLSFHEANQGGGVPLPVITSAVQEYHGPLLYDAAQGVLLAPLLSGGDSLRADVRELQLDHRQLARLLAESRAVAGALPPEYRQVPDALREALARRFRWYDELQQRVDGANVDDPPEERGVFAAARWIVRMFDGATLGDSRAWLYSLEQRPQPGPDAIARFMDTGPESERYGHCEYYATAMCMLLRCLGVPARMAVGYAVQAADEDGVWRAASSNAHAWVEVYFDELGWVAFDPTPSQAQSQAPEAAIADAEPGAEPEREDEAHEPVATADWLRDLDAAARDRVLAEAAGMLGAAAERAESMFTAITAWLPDFLPRSGALRAALLSAPLLLLLVILLRRRRARRQVEKQVLKEMGAQDKRRERGLYFQLLLLLASHGYHKRPSETPLEFARRVRGKGGALHEQALGLTRLYYELRFGARKELVDEFKKALAVYADALKQALKDPRDAESAGGTAATP
jgi:hypothetical protein